MGESLLSGKESVRTWLIIFVILVVTSFVAASWPLITSAIGNLGGGGGTLNTGVTAVSLPFIDQPVNGFLALGLLTVIVVGVVGGVGVALAAINLLLNKQTATVKESDSYQSLLTTLEQREAERLKAMRDGRQSDPVPEHKLPRWSVVSTSLIILLFTLTAAMILSRALVSEGATTMIGNFAINTATFITVGLLLLVLFILVLWLRPQRLDAIEASDYGPIPWDTIWIIISGLLVVGLGVGLVVYFNIPG